MPSQKHDIFQLQVDDERKRRNSGEANFNHIKGHYIITKSHQDKVHSKNVAHNGPNLSVEQGTFQIYDSKCFLNTEYMRVFYNLHIYFK